MTAPARMRRPTLGWGISLLAHAIVLAWLWQAGRPRPVNPDTGTATRIEVWLVKGASTVSARATASATAPSHPVSTRAAAVPRPALSQPAAVVATPSTLTPPNDVETGADADAPAFDLAAARASARAMVHAEPSGLAALPLRLEGKNATPSERVQEQFERARRGNCLKANESMNLLANVAMLAKDIVTTAVDDSGCKW